MNQLMNGYFIDQLKVLRDDLKEIHPEYILERIDDEINSFKQGRYHFNEVQLVEVKQRHQALVHETVYTVPLGVVSHPSQE